jgi:hypothetical protein
VDAVVYYSGSSWTVVIVDVANAVAGKRGAQLSLIFSRFLPKGYSRESFAGKKANTLDQSRIGELGRFVEQGQKVLGVLRSRSWRGSGWQGCFCRRIWSERTGR